MYRLNQLAFWSGDELLFQNTCDLHPANSAAEFIDTIEVNQGERVTGFVGDWYADRIMMNSQFEITVMEFAEA